MGPVSERLIFLNVSKHPWDPKFLQKSFLKYGCDIPIVRTTGCVAVLHVEPIPGVFRAHARIILIPVPAMAGTPHCLYFELVTDLSMRNINSMQQPRNTEQLSKGDLDKAETQE